MSAAATKELQFTAWLRDHGEIPRKLSRIYAADANDTADLYQEMLVQLWRSASHFREQARATTWIYRVCLNTVFTRRRNRHRRDARLLIDDQPRSWPGGNAGTR